MNDYYISLESQEQAVNSNLSIRYKPASNINNYSYTIFRDDQKIEEKIIEHNDYVSITLEDTGNYKIEFHNFDLNNQESVITTGNYLIDKEVPTIKINNKKKTITKDEKFDVMAGISASDNQDGDLTNKITTNIDELDFNTLGKKKIVYKVSDQAGNINYDTAYVNVVEASSNNIIIIEWTLSGLVLVTLVMFLWYRIGFKKEKRLARYAVDSLNDDTLSIMGKIVLKYDNWLSFISKILAKSVIITKHSKRYQKYIDTLGNEKATTLKFVANKIMVGLIFIIIAIISKMFSFELVNSYEMFLAFIVGFFVPDFIYAYKYRKYRGKIENDLLQAIIIMNNAFKSGKSITQAVDIVANQLDGVMAEEFKKISLELSFGLSIDVVFKRLAERIQLEEVTYLTASLTILNRTGGNIIKVFSSIEKTLFNKKKLKLEMKSLTGSSKIITYLLIALPIMFVLFVSLLNANYFTPLLTHPLGIIILGIILILYITYILVVRKVMKIRM